MKIDRDEGISESSIQLMIRNKDHYKFQVIATVYNSSKSLVTRNRSTLMTNMEPVLGI